MAAGAACLLLVSRDKFALILLRSCAMRFQVDSAGLTNQWAAISELWRLVWPVPSAASARVQIWIRLAFRGPSLMPCVCQPRGSRNMMKRWPFAFGAGAFHEPRSAAQRAI